MVFLGRIREERQRRSEEEKKKTTTTKGAKSEHNEHKNDIPL